VPLPPIKARPFYVKDTWPAVVTLAFGVVTGSVAVGRQVFAKDGDSLQLASLGLTLACVVILGTLQIARSRFKDAEEDKKRSPDELRGCLLVIHGVVAGQKGMVSPPEGWLRITLHRVDGEELEQSLEYVGSDDRKKAGRRFRVQAGLIGAVARTGDMRAFDRRADMDFTEWCDYLVQNQGMTRDGAKATRDDRFSFLGVPIKNPGGKEVRAVVYLDASEPGFFDRETAGLIVCGCEGLAAWIDDHYYTKRS
jgi:hypothetical protein